MSEIEKLLEEKRSKEIFDSVMDTFGDVLKRDRVKKWVDHIVKQKRGSDVKVQGFDGKE